MIAKVSRKRRDGRTSFSALTQYLNRVEKTEGQAWTYNTLSMATAAAEMDAVSTLNPRVKDPALHLVLSWPAHERPTEDQAREAGEAALEGLGFDLGADGHLAVMAMHHDTAHTHLHLAANRIHPETGKAVDLWKSYERLHETCRQVELAQGWSHDLGLSEVIYDDEGQAHVVPSDYRNPDTVGLSTPVRDLEVHRDRPSFERYVRDTVGPALRDVVKRGDWQQVHTTLADYGVDLVKRGGGYTLCDHKQPAALHAKGSVLGSWARAARLEQALGPFQAADPATPRPPSEKQAPREPLTPTAARLAPAVYQALRKQFEADRSKGWDAYRDARKQDETQARASRTERWAALKQDMATRRKDAWAARRALPEPARPHPSVTRSLLAFEYAKRREDLKAEIDTERQAQREIWATQRAKLGRPYWREWLREQVEQGTPQAPPAAQVLEGLRHRGLRLHPADDRPPLTPEAPAPVESLSHLTWRVRGHTVIYSTQAQGDVLRDRGHRIDVLRNDAASREQGLKLAAAKWGKVSLTGSKAWIDTTARQAAGLGIEIVGVGREAWKAERQRLAAERQDRSRPRPVPTQAPAVDAPEAVAVQSWAHHSEAEIKSEWESQVSWRTSRFESALIGAQLDKLEAAIRATKAKLTEWEHSQPSRLWARAETLAAWEDEGRTLTTRREELEDGRDPVRRGELLLDPQREALTQQAQDATKEAHPELWAALQEVWKREAEARKKKEREAQARRQAEINAAARLKEATQAWIKQDEAIVFGEYDRRVKASDEATVNRETPALVAAREAILDKWEQQGPRASVAEWNRRVDAAKAQGLTHNQAIAQVAAAAPGLAQVTDHFERQRQARQRANERGGMSL